MKKQTHDLALPGLVAQLDVRRGRLLSLLQASHEGERDDQEWLLCVHEEGGLQPRVIARRLGWRCRARFDKEARRIVLLTKVAQSCRVAVVSVRGEVLAEREMNGAFDVAWHGEHIVVGCHDHSSLRRGKVEIWSSDLSVRIDRLLLDYPVNSVAAENGVIVAEGCDVYVWRPADALVSPALSVAARAVPRECGECALSLDGRLMAFGHDNQRASEPQAVIANTVDLASEIVLINDATRRYVAQVAFSPDGSRLALNLSEHREVRVHSTKDGALLAQSTVPGARRVVWLDDVTLLAGWESLVAFEHLPR